MAKTPTQIRIDADVKRQATELFSNLGLDMSGAVNLFLHQCVLRGGPPFTMEMPHDETASRQSLRDLFNSVEFKDIVKRNNIRDFLLQEEWG